MAESTHLGDKLTSNYRVLVMQSSLIGRLKKYKAPTNGWALSLYEAVSNCLYSLDDLDEAISTNSPYIEIVIYRDLQTIGGSAAKAAPIRDIEIIDNGSGFTQENIDAFQCLDSESSISRGRKGEGRLSWLAYFEKAQIRSSFHLHHSFKNIEFTFSLVPEGISNISEKSLQASPSTSNKTSIYLCNLYDKYKIASQKTEKEIAQNLIIHFLADFFAGRMPRTVVRDEDHATGTCLNDLFSETYKGTRQNDKFTLKGQEFYLEHLMCESDQTQSTAYKHKVHWCAQRRHVQEQKLDELIFLGENAILDVHGKEHFYIGVLQGAYLDECLDDKRTVFNFPKQGDLSFGADITEKELKAQTESVIGRFLEPYLQQARDRSIRVLYDTVEHHCPEYRYLLSSYESELNRINFSSLNPQEIESFLHTLEVKKRAQSKQQLKEILHTGKEDIDLIESKVQELMSTIKDINQVDLTRYVVSRKTILDVFEELMSIQDDGKFVREERIHSLIFPMITSSYTTLPSQHNLWILDERLAFHTLLVSDLPMSHYQEDGDQKEPDLITFREFSHRYVSREGDRSDALHSATIIEFKRPSLKHNDSKNVIDQVLDYAERLREKKITDTKTGRTLILADEAPIYAYAITDIDEKLRRILKRHDFTPTPDSHDGYYTFKKEQRVYFEVLSFDKVLADAKKRNRAFFKKLDLLGS